MTQPTRARSHPWPPGSVIAGKYRIEHEIAVGQAGAVLLATQLALKRHVALKIVPAALRQLGSQTALNGAIAGRLKHPHIVEIYDSGTTRHGDLYLVMEYLDGLPLPGFIDSSPIRIPSLIRIARQVCRGVRHAHRQGIVHRRLKPSSVILSEHETDEGFHAKVIDFGLGVGPELWEPRDEQDAPIDRRSVRYAAPEQLMREPGDARADVYSLGVILFEMITGTPPFAGTSEQVRQLHLNAAPKWPKLEATTGLAELKVVVHRCLAKRPQERYADAAELLFDLDAIDALLELDASSRSHVSAAGARLMPHSAEPIPTTTQVNPPVRGLSLERPFDAPPRPWGRSLLVALAGSAAATATLWLWLLGT